LLDLDATGSDTFRKAVAATDDLVRELAGARAGTEETSAPRYSETVADGAGGELQFRVTRNKGKLSVRVVLRRKALGHAA
jgi:hypothetical protein